MIELITQGVDDNDLYKFSTQKAILAHKQKVPVAFEFKDRRPQGQYTPKFKAALDDQIKGMSELRTAKETIGFLSAKCPWLGDDYLAYLRNFRFNPDQVETKLTDGNLGIRIEGPHEEATMWEVPLMYTISELYFKMIDTNWSRLGQEGRIQSKAIQLDGLHYSDFGTRRRRDFWTQDRVVEIMHMFPTFVGTSNVLLARKYGIKAIGTYPHELVQRMSVLESLYHANRYTMQFWQKTFGARLGIALTDTFGTQAFLRDFDDTLARLFDGVRQDSGDPILFGHDIIAHYNKLGIDPLTKTIVFSDSLNPVLARTIFEEFKGKIRTAFGIGTNFTNDYDGSPALNMVIKLIMCDGIHVVKLSDSFSKAIGDPDALRVALYTHLNVPLDSKILDGVK